MELEEAFDLACDLMVEHVGHGLFRWSNTKRIFGEATFIEEKPMLILSKKLTRLNNVEEVTNCILHEIAHLLTWGDGHGPEWKAKCLELGARPEAYMNERVTIPKLKYKLICNECKTTLQSWYRKPKVRDPSRYQCLHCKTVNCRIEGL